MHNLTLDPMHYSLMHYEHFLCDQTWFRVKSHALRNLCIMIMHYELVDCSCRVFTCSNFKRRCRWRIWAENRSNRDKVWQKRQNPFFPPQQTHRTRNLKRACGCVLDHYRWPVDFFWALEMEYEVVSKVLTSKSLTDHSGYYISTTSTLCIP